MITDTTIGLLPDDRYLRPTSRTAPDTGHTVLELIAPGRLVLTGGREQLADLLRAGLTALYDGHPPVDAEATRWEFGHLGMVKVGGDDEE